MLPRFKSNEHVRSETEGCAREDRVRQTVTGRRFAVIHQGALGDFLSALPLFDGLHESEPGIFIDFWSKAEYGSLLAAKPYLGAVHSRDDPALTPFYHEQLWMDAPVPGTLAQAHVIFVFGQSNSRVLARRLAARCGVPVHWIQSFPDPHARRHVGRFLAEQLHLLGWRCCTGIPRIDPDGEERRQVRRWLERWTGDAEAQPLVIHPGSGGMKKVWPLKRWWSLVDWLLQRKVGPVVVILGPADDPLKTFARATRSRGCLLAEDLSLSRLAAFLAEARLYCGNDSGASHLAAAVGTPSVVVFGPTDPEVWAPRGPHVHVVQDCWKESEVLDWDENMPADDPPPAVTNLLDTLLGSPTQPRP
ncbi:MAG TPA: glycosyltransferase family 9 protein [Syntrophobacteraceae bacterium]|nr:glycosyltransferase family 9 protein [Syntrophobacteraceae bacterium]